MNFGFDDNRWIKMEKFYVEKRGDYNITDDDYQLSVSDTINTNKHNDTASMMMWATELYMEQYEWYVRID